jgi:hypothetical protein
MPGAGLTSSHSGHWLAAGLMAAIVALAACSQEHTATKSEDDDPARLVRVEGTDLKGVALTARAAERLGIKTEPVREVLTPGGTTPVKAVPVAALLYDKNGDVWVYTPAQPRTYVRQRVGVARIDGDLAILGSGPAPGTAVVTVGVAELLGSELGVGGG